MFKLVLKDSEGGEAVFPLTEDLFIGRDHGCNVILAEKKISRRHARFFLQARDAFVEDLKSSNGTFVNGEKLSGARQIQPGDIVTIGTCKFRVLETNPLDDHATTTLVGFKVRDPGERPVPIRRAASNKTQNVTTAETKGSGWFWTLVLGALLGAIIAYFFIRK